MCSDCRVKEAESLNVDSWAGCDDAEYVKAKIICELYRLLSENFSENDYTIIIESKEIFIK
jgi:hypothetical protein